MPRAQLEPLHLRGQPGVRRRPVGHPRRTTDVGGGHTYKEIGAELFIADKTVENHVRNILSKLHLNRRQELIRYAVEHGLD